jgi:predicted nucleic acid-binding protein
MIVVDTNMTGYLFLTSEPASQAEAALLKDTEWAAPLQWRSELRNVLAYYLRKNLLSVSDAHQIMQEATRIEYRREYTVTSLQVLNLVADSTCSAYECEYITLAQDLHVPLITADKQILAQFPDTAVSLDQFIAN